MGFKRAAICDFSVFKEKINSYPEDTILVVFDVDFEFGNNFYFAATTEARDEIMAKLVPAVVEGEKPKKEKKKEKKDGDEGIDGVEEESESGDEYAGQIFEYK